MFRSLCFREADRVILKTCQQEGANQNTFQAISCLLGNKTPSEVIGCSADPIGRCAELCIDLRLVSSGVSQVSGFDAFVSNGGSSDRLRG